MWAKWPEGADKRTDPTLKLDVGVGPPLLAAPRPALADAPSFA